MCRSRPVDLIPFLFRIWGWGTLPGGGRRYRLLFRAPKGLQQISPAAERRGDSRRATPWVRYRFSTVALKGRNKSVHPTRIVRQLRQGLFRPFRAGVLPPLLTQGGATRLRRSALPWAAMWLPLRGENLWITRRGSPRGQSVILNFVITPRSQPNRNRIGYSGKHQFAVNSNKLNTPGPAPSMRKQSRRPGSRPQGRPIRPR